ncbi:TPA: YpiB family protein [Staphylococcus pseudintermedius]|uniref:YpiB family protein n=1 Tax=Staphylococcus pseudintermedius TaxID=283734 RepID=UPI0018EF3AC9|nr:YpiB family protein [Staphylococcus pseudintermedius]EGQ3084473.1 YpiB family protein [Staphylococcus pseudintermedius]EHC9945478.1 YpiB family protein [Staphylococcus pseudintermedius]ELI4041613.1 YpiB family protein [Staphylococcus pseudintermedius]MDK3736001.1 YpiB family protein [Staphylococcus pseudintermedius]MDK4140778.1 YpiB family protein [Staphylococcus pseudintermedius]
MLDTRLNFEKRDFIEYLLFHYQFKSRISVWLLNFIKTNHALIEKIHFVDQIVADHPTLEMAVSDAPVIAIQYHEGETLLMNTDEIFHQVIYHSQQLDVKIHFNQEADRDLRLDHLLLQQLLTTQNGDAYHMDMYHIEFSNSTEQQIIHLLKSHIDLSLNLKDIQLFKHYTKILNLIKLRHITDKT